MKEVRKAFKNFNFKSKVTLGLILGVVLLVVDSLGLYNGQPLPDVVMRVAQGVVLVIVALGLADAANLEKQSIIDKAKDLLTSAPVLGSIVELVNLVLNALPGFADMIPAGAANALHALAAALVALGLRQKIGEARLNSNPIPEELEAKHKVFAE